MSQKYRVRNTVEVMLIILVKPGRGERRYNAIDILRILWSWGIELQPEGSTIRGNSNFWETKKESINYINYL